MSIQGIWFPIITPFHNGKVDFESYQKLLEDALKKGVHGVIPLGTTGESPTISAYEYDEIVKLTVKIVNKKVPVYIGAGGNHTAAVVDKVKHLADMGIDGVLSVVPYYNKPSQQGLIEHFTAVANAAPQLGVILYNIPYRTCINMENATLLELAKVPNIKGVKDSCGNFAQSMELLVNKPADFSIFTGDDIMFFTTITNGGDGGILASSHVSTEKWLKIYDLVKQNDLHQAFGIWKTLVPVIPLLFKEPNPTPIKFILKELGLIKSDEARLPLTPISNQLKTLLKEKVISELK